ncbi:MAG: diguanylate cyclase domain-containing protein [Jatrophihabitans sp.]
MARHRRGEGCPAVLFLDLDGFKAVNDGYGHAAGDQLLHAVAARLLATVRASDLLARLAGDEPVVLCEAHPDEDRTDGVAALATRLRRCFAEPFALDCGRLEIGASIGVARAPVETAEQLLARADAAMYVDKRQRQRQAGRPQSAGPGCRRTPTGQVTG